MPINDFKQFANSTGANVFTQAEYEAQPTLLANGVQSGLASSKQFNKTLRQSSTIGKVIGDFITTKTGEDVLDDGTSSTILDNLSDSMNLNMLLADGSTSAYTVASPIGNKVMKDGLTININTSGVGTNAISTPTLSVNGLTPSVIKKLNTKSVAVKLAIGDIPVRGVYQYVASGSYWLLLNPAMNGKLIAVRKYTTAGTTTYTETDGTNYVRAVVQGAGAAGGGTQLCAANQRAGGGGGGSGARGEGTFYENFSGVTITVGAKGTGVSGAAGNNGGTSSFGALLSASGGNGGPLGIAVAVNTNDGWLLALGGGGGNTVSGGDVHLLGGVGDKAITMTTGAISGRGAAAPFSTAAASEVSSTSGSFAGYNANRAGYGGGGAVCGQSGGSAQSGGNGGDGEVIVYEFG